jgi:uncharacterized Zn finger protein
MAPRRPASRSGRAPRKEPSSTRGGFSGDRTSVWWPPTSVPIPVEGGLQARSQRGRIGDTWWSARFLAVLDSFGLSSRLQRGKRYARTGQVIAMEVSPSQVSASVQGSRAKPYRVFIETATLSEPEWRSVEDAMSARASFVAALLAGEMPENIEDAFAESACSLFPEASDDIVSACSCPDWENPCKHIAAVYYLLAEAFDSDPFLIFTWRGRDKDELLGSLRVRRRSARAGRRRGDASVEAVAGPGGEPQSDDGAGHGDEDTGQLGWPRTSHARIDSGGHTFPGHFWRSADLSDVEVRPRLAVAPDLLLRQLDPAPLGGEANSILEQLRPMYEVFTAAVMSSLDEEAD